MEKLKPIHKHDLTNIIKVGMFALMLLLPFLVFLPNAFYYGFNEHANTQTKQIETKENILVDFNQICNYQQLANTYTKDNLTLTNNQDGSFTLSGYTNSDATIYLDMPRGTHTNHKVFYYPQIYNNNVLTISFYSGYNLGNPDNQILNTGSYIFIESGYNMTTTFYLQCFDVTNMELTNLTSQQFSNIFTDTYYEYTESKIEEITITTSTETIIDIPYQMNYAWQTTWELPLFNWTSNSILNTGLNAFCNGLGIVSTSYISNFLTYELVIVAIYIVLDIVLTLFTWLTHIGQKD